MVKKMENETNGNTNLTPEELGKLTSNGIMPEMDEEEDPEVRIYPTPSFPGNIAFPGFGVSERLVEFLVSEQVLYLMQPVNIE